MTQNKLWSFVIVTQGDGKPGDLGFETLFSTRDEVAKEALTKILWEQNAGFRRSNQTRNRREVIVTHIDKAEAERWQNTAGRNGLKAKPVKTGHVFSSATEASGHVGLRHNEVAMILSRCTSTGEKQATVRGVTFAYHDDVAETASK
jgi:hypothetical protein